MGHVWRNIGETIFNEKGMHLPKEILRLSYHKEKARYFPNRMQEVQWLAHLCDGYFNVTETDEDKSEDSWHTGTFSLFTYKNGQITLAR